jgi:serine/threonine protein kinase/Flp pilus assembly protein TadD
MGRVYLGHSPAGKQVAVKIIQPRYATDQNFLVRFRREVEAAKKVSGAYTAAVIEADPTNQPPWLVTEFVYGPSLAEAVERGGRLQAEAVWRLAGGLVEALKAMHARDLVHRDLKPANVLLAEDGPKLIDFGIAKSLGNVTNATLPNVTVPGWQPGTPGFMAPEQRHGIAAGPECDVYALGKVIAFAATGSMDIVNSIGTDTWMQPGRAVRPHEYDGVPREFRELVARCLSTNRSDRPKLGQLMDMVLEGKSHYPQAYTLKFWREPLASVIRYKVDELSRQLGEEPEAGPANPVRPAGGATAPAPPRPHPPTQLSGDGADGQPRGTRPLAGDSVNFEPTRPIAMGPGPYGTKRLNFPPTQAPATGWNVNRDPSALTRGLSGTLFAAYRPHARVGRRVGAAQNAAAYALDGDAAFAARRFPEARNAYRLSLDLDPKNASVLVDLGRTYCAMQQLMPAETSFLQALEADDLLIAAHRNRYVAVQTMMGRQPELARVREEAEAACEAVLAADAQEPMGLANQGDAHCCLSRYREALSAYERALGLDPGNPRLNAKCDYARRQGR